MQTLICIILVLLILIGLFLVILKPRTSRKQAIIPLMNYDYAHRGLHNDLYCENSIQAFKNAIDNGYGIELDVQVTKDHQLVVFHDYNLFRGCGIDCELDSLTYAELQALNLFNSDEKIPLFSSVLELINGKTPVIVEIKQKGKKLEVSQKTCMMLEKYSGLFCVESFNPFSIQYVRNNYPRFIRGQLSADFIKDRANLNLASAFLLTNLLTNVLTRPDFIAYDVNSTHKLAFNLCVKLLNGTSVIWTINNPSDFIRMKKVYQMMIFENFEPQKISSK